MSRCSTVYVLSFCSAEKMTVRRSVPCPAVSRGRGLTRLCPQTSVGCPIESVTHYKRHSWGAWALPFQLDLQWVSLHLLNVLPALPLGSSDWLLASRLNSTTESVHMAPTEAASTMLVLPFSTKNPSLLLISDIYNPRQVLREHVRRICLFLQLSSSWYTLFEPSPEAREAQHRCA